MTLIILMAWVGTVGVVAQEDVVIPDSIVCACELVVESVLTISDRDGDAGLSQPLVIERLESGEYLVVPTEEQGRILVFDELGRYVRDVGRPGEGPREFGMVLAIRSASGDSVAVSDAGNRRLVILDGDLGFSRLMSSPVGGSTWFDVTPDGGILMMATISDATVSERLHLMNPSMERIRSFMTMPSRRTRPDLRRGLAVGKSGLVAVSHGTPYVVEIWDLMGTHVETIERDAQWFPRNSSVRSDSELSDAPPAPVQANPRIDSQGRLWTMSYVSDREWEEALDTVRSIFGEAIAVPEGGRNGYQDSVIEIIDLETHELLGSIRVDPYLRFISNDGYAASYRLDEVGRPFIDVWRFELQR